MDWCASSAVAVSVLFTTSFPRLRKFCSLPRVIFGEKVLHRGRHGKIWERENRGFGAMGNGCLRYGGFAQNTGGSMAPFPLPLSRNMKCSETRVHSRFGDRCFVGPRIWHNLPASLRYKEVSCTEFTRPTEYIHGLQCVCTGQ